MERKAVVRSVASAATAAGLVFSAWASHANGTIQVKYATEKAERQEVIVDGRAVPGTDAASGEVEAPVHCDPLEHTVVLIAYDQEGRRTAQTKFLHTEMPGASS